MRAHHQHEHTRHVKPTTVDSRMIEWRKWCTYRHQLYTRQKGVVVVVVTSVHVVVVNIAANSQELRQKLHVKFMYPRESRTITNKEGSSLLLLQLTLHQIHNVDVTANVDRSVVGVGVTTACVVASPYTHTRTHVRRSSNSSQPMTTHHAHTHTHTKPAKNEPKHISQ